MVVDAQSLRTNRPLPLGTVWLCASDRRPHPGSAVHFASPHTPTVYLPCAALTVKRNPSRIWVKAETPKQAGATRRAGRPPGPRPRAGPARRSKRQRGGRGPPRPRLESQVVTVQRRCVSAGPAARACRGQHRRRRRPSGAAGGRPRPRVPRGRWWGTRGGPRGATWLAPPRLVGAAATATGAPAVSGHVTS